jgi:hypothetical protein
MPNFRKRALAGRFERRKELCVRLGLSSPAALATFLQCGEEMIPTDKYPQPKVTIQLIKSTPLTIKMLKNYQERVGYVVPWHPWWCCCCCCRAPSPQLCVPTTHINMCGVATRETWLYHRERSNVNAMTLNSIQLQIMFALNVHTARIHWR